MNLIWRFLWTILISRFSSKVDFLDETITHFTVLPTDIDVLKHMNNGRYFSFLDLGRINWTIRSGIISHFRKYHIYAVVASETMRFKKSLQLFQRFEIITRIIGWDDKFFYVKHYIKRKNDLHAIGVIKGRLLSPNGPISPQKLFEIMGIRLQSPPLPDWLNQWNGADQAIHDDFIAR